MKNQSKKLRVYLSKSKQGTMDSLMKARELLSKYNIELIEFVGGEYTSETLLSCDIVLVLPYSFPKSYHYDFWVGKGQYSEIELAIGRNIPVYYSICLGDELYVSNDIDDKDVDEIDWKTKFAHIWCNEMMKPLHEYVDGIILEDKSIDTIIRPMLACIKIKT